MIPPITTFEMAWVIVFGLCALAPFMAAAEMFAAVYSSSAPPGTWVDAMFQVSLGAFIAFVAALPILVRS